MVDSSWTIGAVAMATGLVKNKNGDLDLIQDPNIKYMEYSCIITTYLPIYGLIIDPHNDQLSVGVIAQLVEHCTGIAEVRV